MYKCYRKNSFVTQSNTVDAIKRASQRLLFLINKKLDFNQDIVTEEDRNTDRETLNIEQIIKHEHTLFTALVSILFSFVEFHERVWKNI